MNPTSVFLKGSIVALALLLLLAGPTYGGDDVAKKSEGKPAAPALDQQSYLGLGVAPLPPALTTHLAGVIGKGRGVLIEHVMKGSPADQAGLKVHDIVVSFNNQDVYSPEQLVKLVRNAEFGSDIALGYVRAGKNYDTKVKLATPRDPGASSALRRSEDEKEAARSAPGQHERERLRQNDPRPWATFKSMTLTKTDDGKYQAEIDFHDKDKKVLHREYVGSREEIRKAIAQDKALPEDEREHLLRSLDQQNTSIFRYVAPQVFRDFMELNSDLFEWPDRDF